ncbi:MAG: AMP-binding protein [Planctomycetota bacterium]
MQINSAIEFESQEKIAVLNAQLLREHIAYCYERSPFYHRRFDEMGIDLKRIRSIDDLNLLPCTTKEDLECFTQDFLCVPEREIIDTCQTSGTTGKPVSLLQTVSDLERVGYNEKISFSAAGVTAEDSVMIACALGRCFMAGLAYFEGVRQLGARAIRTGSGNPSVLAQSVLLHHPSIIVCVPSQAVLMGEAIQNEGWDPSDLGVKTLICIGEPVRTTDLELSQLGRRLRQLWGCDIVGTYASTEMATSFTDCVACRGGHYHPELITVEILDDNGNFILPGQFGEVVVTPLQVTGMPLLRYCTGDIATYYTDPCPCGRKAYRLSPIVGRKQQKMKIRGTTVYPNAIFSVLQGIHGVKNYYLEVGGEYELSESVRVIVGVERGVSLPAPSIAEKLRGYIRVKPEVEVRSVAEVAAKTLPEGKRKAVTFFDNRIQNNSARIK